MSETKWTPGPGPGVFLPTNERERATTMAHIDGLNHRIRELESALRQTLDAMRALRGLAFTGSRIPVERYPQHEQAEWADAKARAALAKARGETP